MAKVAILDASLLSPSLPSAILAAWSIVLPDGPEAEKPRPESMRSAKGKRVAVTLRRNQVRHLRMKVLSAQTHRSAQNILTEALDRYLDAESLSFAPDCPCLKE